MKHKIKNHSIESPNKTEVDVSQYPEPRLEHSIKGIS